MRSQARRGNRACHSEAAIKERPVESLAIEGDKNRALRDARGEFMKERILFRKTPHEELFDLKRAGIPPRESDEKGVRSRSARQTGSLCVEKKPLGWVCQSGTRPARYFGVTSAGKKFESDSGWLGKSRCGEPVAKNEMLTKMIFGNTGADQTSNGVFLIGLAQSCRTRRSWSRGPQSSESREFVGRSSHLATQPVEYGESRFFGARREIARRTDAGRAAFVARAGRDQLARFAQEKVVRAEERCRKTDTARISIVEIKIRLEEFLQVGRGRISEPRWREIIRIAEA